MRKSFAEYLLEEMEKNDIDIVNIDNEIISVGSSIYNHKIVNINTKTDLFFKSNDYEQKIPKIIIIITK